MKKPRPSFHFARVASSPRLQRVVNLLRDGRYHSTMGIIRKANVCNAATCISELRRQGFDIPAPFHGDGKWQYKMYPVGEK